MAASELQDNLMQILLNFSCLRPNNRTKQCNLIFRPFIDHGSRWTRLVVSDKKSQQPADYCSLLMRKKIQPVAILSSVASRSIVKSVITSLPHFRFDVQCPIGPWLKRFSLNFLARSFGDYLRLVPVNGEPISMILMNCYRLLQLFQDSYHTFGSQKKRSLSSKNG